jgi:hypothetical protein
MFLPPQFVLIDLAVILIAGAILGGLTGWLLAWLLRPTSRNFQPDAVLGSGAFFLVQVLYGLSDNNVSFVNGRALGWHGLVLNHVVALRAGFLLAAVVAWRVRKWRHAVASTT